jgi:epidermal growth factor receptor substrate 15
MKSLFFLVSLFSISLGQEVSLSSSPSASQRATSSCSFRLYNISNDFSGTQGQNGWYYGYNNAGTFTQFTIYDTSGTTNEAAWFHSLSEWIQIGHNIIIPNMAGSGGAGYCSDFGNKSPVLQWIPPANLCYQDVTISLYLSPKAAIGASLSVNGNTPFFTSNLATTYTNSFNVYGLYSLNLEIDPYDNGCNDPQTQYSLVITPIGPSITANPSITSTADSINTVSSLPSPSSSATYLNITYPSQSASATTSCSFRSYNANSDFSTQGKNGWYYGYYNNGVFTQFTHYQTTAYTSSLAWNYNAASYGYISATYIMPNGASSCGTPSYGNIAPVLRWINPGSCYNDVTIYLSLSPGTTSVLPTLTVNGNSLYAPGSGAVYSNYFNAYDVYSIELSVGPLNGNCNAGQTTYSLIISPMGSSNTVKTTSTPTNSPKLSSSIVSSPSNTLSATATATVFYLGNWTDFGQYNYAMADIVSYNSMTIYQCQLNCWLNPLCGLIVVETPCTTISLTDPAIYTTACNVCWLKLTSGWIVSANPGSKSIMLYDRVYPPTTSSRTTYSPTASSLATSSVVTYSTLNFCSTSGKTITLPFIGSSTNVMTNAVGSNYGNSWSCNVYINGAGVAQGFLVNFTNFATEGPGADPLRIYNSAGTLLHTYGGNLPDFILYISGTSTIQLTFTTDGTVVGSGVNAIVSLVYSSISGSPSQTATLSESPDPSSSPLPSRSNSGSASATSTVFYSGNWTDYDNVYWNNPINNYLSYTINQCMITCWLNPLCGGISVNNACANIDLNSSNIYSTICSNCYIAPKATSMTSYPGAYLSNTAWKSFIIYDKIFPPTISVASSRTPTVSAIPTSSVVTYSTINYCTNWGTSVTLPFIGSSIYTMTNIIGGQYVNNLGCSVNIYGAGSAQQFKVNISSLNTEGCCDFFTVYNSNNNIIARYSGSVPTGTTFFTSGPFIKVAFTSDGSNVGTGVFATVSLEYTSMSASPSVTGSSSTSKSPSYSPLVSTSSYKTSSSSYSSLNTKSSTNSVSQSYSSLNTKSSTNSVSTSKSASVSASVSTSNSFSNSPSASSSISGSSSSSITMKNTYTPSYTISSKVSSTSTISMSVSPTVTKSISSIGSSTRTIKNSISSTAINTQSLFESFSASYSNSMCPTQSVSATFSSSISMSPVVILSDNEVGAKLMDSLIGNRTSLTNSETIAIFNSVQNLPAAQITNLLRTAGALALAGDPTQVLQISTDNFKFQAQVVPPKPLNISLQGLNLNVPNLNLSGVQSAVTMVSWTSNPYKSGKPLDTPVLSLSVSSLSGKEVPIHNLTEPIQFKYKLNIPTNDPRLDIPTYQINCYDNFNYKITSEGPSFVNLARNSSKYIIPCPNKNYFIGCDLNSTMISFACPKPILEAKCMYWNSTLGIWSSDGCIVHSISADELVCNCTHMTDFGSRMDAVYAANEAIFANAANVYSLEGLIKYRQFYITFGVIALFGFITFGIGLYFDAHDSVKYYELLVNDPIIKYLKEKSGFLIDKCFDYDVQQTEKKDNESKCEHCNDNEKNKKEKEKEGTIIKDEITGCYKFFTIFINRLLFQHSQFAAFLRFDPKLPRLFRLLIIFVAQFNSLFITALLFAFKYGNGEDPSNNVTIPLIDTILLAAITALLNIPALTLLSRMTLAAGIDEFKWRYPILFDELIRRHKFEEELFNHTEEELSIENINLKKISIITKKANSKGGNKYNLNNYIKNNNADEDDDDAEDFITWFLKFIFRKNKKEETEKKKGSMTNAYIHAISSYPTIKKSPAYYSYLPFHTLRGGIVFTLSIGWFIWCLNYLLLFAASHSQSVSQNMLETFGYSELTTILLTQPITLLILLSIAYVYNKLSNKFTCLKSKKTIPSFFYHSDPFISPKSTILSTSFSYILFLYGPSQISKSSKLHHSSVKNLGYTTLKGLMEGLNHNEETYTISGREAKIIKLYETFKSEKKMNKLIINIE